MTLRMCMLSKINVMASPSSSLQKQILKQPFSSQDAQAIKRELQEILASHHFRNSRRYPAFLSYVIETSLDGRSEEIKERNIGVEAFGRPHNYDTNLDPVVRNTAGEVRKRLALYYAEQPVHDDGIEISLQPGSYVPEFFHMQALEVQLLEAMPSYSDQAAHPVPHAVPDTLLEAELPPVPVPSSHVVGQKFSHRWLPWGWIAAVLLLIAAGFGGWYWWHSAHATQLLWANYFNSRKEVLIVLPEAPFPPPPTPPNWVRDNPDVALEDLVAIMPAVGVLMEHHVPYNVKLDPAVTLADLVNRPVILIGGPTNKWTVTLTEQLRYHMKSVGTNLYIEDAQHPGASVCTYETAQPGGSVVNDCAMIAGFHSDLTANTVMVIAGTGRNGTQAVGAWIVSSGLDARLSELFPPGWHNRNFEIVLKTTVIEGKNSAPEILRTYSW